MSPAAPSRGALRRLAVLCGEPRFNAPKRFQSSSSRSSSISSSISSSSVQQLPSSTQLAEQSKSGVTRRPATRAKLRQLYSNSRPARTFTSSRSSPSSSASPSANAEDPPLTSTSSPATKLPDVSTYYTLFPRTLPSGPPPSGPFTIPLPSLRQEFLQLQTVFHPDKFPAGTGAHQKSLALSALLNSAYRTLSDPLLRAQYILNQQHGIDVLNEDNTEHASKVDQETLMEVMDAQEVIEDASATAAEGRAEQGEREVDALKSQNDRRIEDTVQSMARAFEAGDVDEATRQCVKLKYWRSLKEGLDSWEPGKEVRLIH